MATTTTNYGLVKPALTDSPPDITVMNSNWDKIDTQLKAGADARAVQVNKDGSIAMDKLTVGSRKPGSTVGKNSTACGTNNVASGENARAEGQDTTASGSRSHAEGHGSIASGSVSHAEGGGTIATGDASHATGYGTKAYSHYSHAEGYNNQAGGSSTDPSIGQCAHAEGSGTSAYGIASHSEGFGTIAKGTYSHAEGNQTKVYGNNSHVEGYLTQAGASDTDSSLGQFSHAEGHNSKSTGDASHAEGYGTQATGEYAHAEGQETYATGSKSHAEGVVNHAVGIASHAEGGNNWANGNYSHVGGYGNSANENFQTVIGQYNSPSTSSLFIVGNGTSDTARKNALRLASDGTLWTNGFETDSVARFGFTYHNLFNIYTPGQANGIKIKTNFPIGWDVMHNLILEGYDYQGYRPIHLEISYYQYSVENNFKCTGYSSINSFAPTIKVAYENSKVVIWLDYTLPFSTITAREICFDTNAMEQMKGWTIAYEALSGTATQVTDISRRI